MSEQLNGNKIIAWQYFRRLVARALVTRNLVDSVQDGYDFADDLDMSFNELYATVPRDKWTQHIEKDVIEYENDPARKGRK